MFNPATEQIMKKRIFYIISFLVIFCIEVLIALYVRDRFIRPYVGDMLVVVLVKTLVDMMNDGTTAAIVGKYGLDAEKSLGRGND